MPLHGLRSVTLGVPDVPEAACFYEDFGLLRTARDTFATTDGGDQLKLTVSPQRRLVEACFAADDTDDLARTQSSLAELGIISRADAASLTFHEPATATRIVVAIAPRVRQASAPAEAVNSRGRLDRVNARAASLLRTEPVRPRRLGHFVLGTTDFDQTYAVFTRGLGFQVSDLIRDVGVFLRCSTDHHNVLIQRAPVPFLHHTSWQVDDVDEIGRGAHALLAQNPERHVWGLGRHYAGSNYFWYFRDPAGNYAEYHCDMDCIPEDALWTPEMLEGDRGLYAWGPPPPPSFITPDDLAGLMISGHSK